MGEIRKRNVGESKRGSASTKKSTSPQGSSFSKNLGLLHKEFPCLQFKLKKF